MKGIYKEKQRQVDAEPYKEKSPKENNYLKFSVNSSNEEVFVLNIFFIN